MVSRFGLFCDYDCGKWQVEENNGVTEAELYLNKVMKQFRTSVKRNRNRSTVFIDSIGNIGTSYDWINSTILGKNTYTNFSVAFHQVLFQFHFEFKIHTKFRI